MLSSIFCINGVYPNYIEIKFMEYQFVRGLTGEYRIKCSMGHEVVGRWLEQEVYTDKRFIDQLLSTIKQIKAGASQEFSFQGKEISISLLHDEVTVQENILSTDEELPQESEFDYYTSESTAGCGLEDFEQLLNSWLDFIG